MESALPKLNRDDIRLLLAGAQLGHAKPGQVLVREGHPPPALFIVRGGSVLLQRNANGYVITAATLETGRLFGESVFISPAPRPASASAVAADETALIALAPQRLNPLFEENPALAGRFFHSIALTLSRRLRSFNEQGTGNGARIPDWEIL